jgi:hypothetical protein
MKFLVILTSVLVAAAVIVGLVVPTNTLPDIGALKPYADSMGNGYIFIFTSTCPHCIASFTSINTLIETGHNVTTICLDCGGDPSEAQEFMLANQLNNVPLTIQIKGGKIVWMWQGELDSTFQPTGAK